MKIGVLAGPDGIPAWFAEVLAEISGLAEVHLKAVVIDGSAPRAHPPESGWLLDQLTAWSRAGSLDPFRMTPFPAGLSTFDLRDASAIRNLGLDVLISAGVDCTPACDGLARRGVWSLLLGALEDRGSAPAYWRCAVEGRWTAELHLLAHETFHRARVVDSIYLPADLSLRYTRNQTSALAAAAMLLGRSLLGSRQADLRILESGAGAGKSASWEAVPFIARKLLRSAWLRARTGGKPLDWYVGIRRARGLVDFANPARGDSFRQIATPKGEYFADPFLVEQEDRDWLFVERYRDSTGMGSLACAEVGSNGEVGEAVDIFQPSYHCSYPHVFASRGEFFMIPETSAAESVQLFRATRFPFEWKLEAVLLDGVRLVDTTPYWHGGKWYFFASTDPTQTTEQGYLFFADSLDGKWQYHPVNPISVDARSIRGAGRLFEQGGQLYRPTQDSTRTYGYAVNFSRIERLSTREFVERPVGKMLPDFRSGIRAVHSFNRSSRFEVVDWQGVRR